MSRARRELCGLWRSIRWRLADCVWRHGEPFSQRQYLLRSLQEACRPFISSLATEQLFFCWLLASCGLGMGKASPSEVCNWIAKLSFQSAK